MLEKSKAMQNENTALKVKTSELQGEWAADLNSGRGLCPPLPVPLFPVQVCEAGGRALRPSGRRRAAVWWPLNDL